MKNVAQDAAVQPDGNGLLPPPGGVSGGSSRKVSIRESPVVEGGDGGAPAPSPCNATQTADGAASAHAAAASAHPHLGVKAYGVRLAPVIRDSFASYCRETTLHGWKYVTSGSSTSCEKSTWYGIHRILLRLSYSQQIAFLSRLLLLLVSLSTASILVYRAVGDFMSHTVSTNMESLSTTFDNIYFPVREMNSPRRH